MVHRAGEIIVNTKRRTVGPLVGLTNDMAEVAAEIRNIGLDLTAVEGGGGGGGGEGASSDGSEGAVQLSDGDGGFEGLDDFLWDDGLYIHSNANQLQIFNDTYDVNTPGLTVNVDNGGNAIIAATGAGDMILSTDEPTAVIQFVSNVFFQGSLAFGSGGLPIHAATPQLSLFNDSFSDSVAGVTINSDDSGNVMLAMEQVAAETNRFFSITLPTGEELRMNHISLSATHRVTAPEFYTSNTDVLMHSFDSFDDGAGDQAGTLLNAPVAGNPIKWIAIDDGGEIVYVPAWAAPEPG